MEPAHGDLQDNLMKSRITDGLDTDVSKWKATFGITFLLDTTFTCNVFLIFELNGISLFVVIVWGESAAGKVLINGCLGGGKVTPRKHPHQTTPPSLFTFGFCHGRQHFLRNKPKKTGPYQLVQFPFKSAEGSLPVSVLHPHEEAGVGPVKNVPSPHAPAWRSAALRSAAFPGNKLIRL